MAKRDRHRQLVRREAGNKGGRLRRIVSLSAVAMLILLGCALIAGCRPQVEAPTPAEGPISANRHPVVIDIGGYTSSPSDSIDFTAVTSDLDPEDIVEQVEFKVYYNGKWGATYIDPQIADGWSYSWDSVKAGVTVDNKVYIRVRAYDGLVWGSCRREGPFTVDNRIPPVANANSPYLGNEGSPVTFDASASYDPDGTIALYEWDTDGDGTFELPNTDPWLDHTWVDDYSGSIGLRVADNDGFSGTDSTTVTINNVPPTIDAGPDQTTKEGKEISISAAFTDPGLLDTHTAQIDWGDGTIDTAVVSETDGSGTVSGNHTYDDDGLYTVTVTIIDDDGGTGYDEILVTVKNVPRRRPPAGSGDGCGCG